MIPSRRPRSHPFAVASLLVLAALVGAVAIASIWANRQLLDTPSWVSVSGRLLESRQIRHRVAVFLGDELVAETETQLAAAGQDEAVEEMVPRLRRQSTGLAERAMATPRFRVVWLRANRSGHRALLRVLDAEGDGRDGERTVALNLTPALRELADTVGASGLARQLGVADLGTFVQPGAGRIEVLEADELNRAQNVVRTIRHVPVPATIAAVLLLALALLLGRRRLSGAFLGVGIALAASGALALLARALAGHQIVDQLLSRNADREAAEAAWRIATSTLVDLSTAAIGLGALIVIWALLSGPSDGATGARRRLAPLLRTPLARLWTLLGAVLIFVAMVAWAPIAAFESPLGVLLFAAVFGGGALVVAREAILD
ncbi:MAG TPA: hypothetical protein VH299_14195 [Solirubrobacterales bacterium]|nr:hypothetical protein [Solirubrobacterales bacterium]